TGFPKNREDGLVETPFVRMGAPVSPKTCQQPRQSWREFQASLRGEVGDDPPHSRAVSSCAFPCVLAEKVFEMATPARAGVTESVATFPSQGPSSGAPTTHHSQMQVRKRNGSLEPADVNKIVRAVERCAA